MLSVRGRHYPRVLARLPYREAGPRECGIGERTHGDRHDVRCRARNVVDGRAALGTEAERPRVSLVGDPDVFARATGSADATSWEPRLEPEGAPGPALAREAVADRDSHGLSFDHQTQLAAAAGGPPRDHGEQPTSAQAAAGAEPSGVGVQGLPGRSQPCLRDSRLTRRTLGRWFSGSVTAVTDLRWCCCTGIPARMQPGIGSLRVWRRGTRLCARTCAVTADQACLLTSPTTVNLQSAPWLGTSLR
jgi:hypothetical protein